MSLHFLILALIFAAGYASQRGRTCAVSAAFEIAKRRRARRFIGYLFAASISLAVLSVISVFQPDLFAMFRAQELSGWTVLGGIVFAAGAYINGRCALGTIARLGSGDLVRIGTLLGIFCGVYLASSILPHRPAAEGAPLFSVLSPAIRIAIAGAALTALAMLVRRVVPAGVHPGQWPIPKAMLVIGLVNGLLVWLARDWSYTSLFRHVARGEPGTGFGMIGLTVLIVGAVSAGAVNRQLAWNIGALRDWVLAGVGGTLMGLGVVLVPGGNDTMLLVGIPLVLPHLVVGYGIVYATLIVMAWSTPDRAPA